jgi:hypothetical protein
MFVTDGTLERDAAGMNIAAILTVGIDMHAREAVQHITPPVLRASGGELRDDAMALRLDWHGGPPRDRDATSGANRTGRADPGAARSPQPVERPTQTGADSGGTPCLADGGALAAGEPAAAFAVGRGVVELVVVVEG